MRPIWVGARRRSSIVAARTALALVVALPLVACSPQGVPTDTLPQDGATLPRHDPGATAPPRVRQPLPEPLLTDPREVGAAIASPLSRAQGVVSMLHGLGIGIYHLDGSPIRRGDERGPGDPWVYEDEVYALIQMAAAESRRDLIGFGDWHAGLRSLGLEMSVTELAEAYEETYLGGYDSWDDDSWDDESFWDEDGAFWDEDGWFSEDDRPFFVDMILASGLDLDSGNTTHSHLTRLQAWLLLLDGFVVRPDGDAVEVQAMAGGGAVLAGTNDDTTKWGGASAKIRRPLGRGDLAFDLYEAAARLETLTRSVRFTLSPAHHSAHEGHDGEGDPVDFELWFQPYDEPLYTPFGDEFYLVPRPDAEGLPVRWEATPQRTLNEHGSLRDERGADPLAGPTPTGFGGRVVISFTPRREEADGEGEVSTDMVAITAVADLHEVARRTWDLPPELLLYLDRSAVTKAQVDGADLATGGGAMLEIEWHEVRGLRITMVDEYDISFEFPAFRGAEMSLGEVRRVGTDRFSGFLALRDDGTYRGIMRGSTNSDFYVRALDQDCEAILTGSQDLLVTAEIVEQGRGGDVGHPIRLRFYPISPPELDEYPLPCDYELDFYWGSEPFEDPRIDPEEAVPSQFYAPFNDRRITAPDESSFLTAVPEFGSWTYVYHESAPGFGGGTWTVTVEVVEPER